MTTTHKEIYASAEESKAVLRSIPVTPAHLEVLRLIDAAGLNEQGVTNAKYVSGIVDVCAAVVKQRNELLASLQEVTMVLDALLNVRGNEPDPDSISGRALAAITKATGGAA